MTEKDWAVLESRVCCNHCDEVDLVPFKDIQRIRCARGRIEKPQMVSHCKITPDASVLVALVEKLNDITDDWIAEQANEHTVTWVRAQDKVDGRLITSDEISASLDNKLRGFRRNLPLFIGMRALLTSNEDQSKGA